MAEPRKSGSSAASDEPGRQILKRPALSLVEPRRRRRSRPARLFRVIRSVFRTLPIFNARFKPCHIAAGGAGPNDAPGNLSGARVTGTLFGYRKGRVSFSIQENPRCIPTLLVELAIQTQVLFREMNSGMVRLALECEKKRDNGGRGQHRTSSALDLLDQPLWTTFTNGKKSGYGLRREATDDDLSVMELLSASSMSAGVLPTKPDSVDGEMAYVRASFDHVVGSKDSETFYMISPDGNSGPELTIFFVRV